MINDQGQRQKIYERSKYFNCQKMNPVFSNRQEAGRKLASKLTAYLNNSQAIVLGLPRGGVPVAYEIAKILNLPLDVCLVKKLTISSNSEIVIGAIAEDALVHDYSGRMIIIDQDITQTYEIDPETIRAIAARAKAELKWRDACYRHFRPLLKIRERVVILVDDGIATGSTIHAAVTALRQHKPKQIIIATPIASLDGVKRIKTYADDLICLITAKSLYAVDFWYEDFSPVTDQEVCELLSQETHQSTTVVTT